jgi:hypothetical protein
VQYVQGDGFRCNVRRIEPSPSYKCQFGMPTCTCVTPSHFLGRIIPLGRRMTKPTGLSVTDRDGVAHECVAEAFDTKHNILVLLYPKASLTKTTIIPPDGLAATA